jgi:hypothetical protein
MSENWRAHLSISDLPYRWSLPEELVLPIQKLPQKYLIKDLPATPRPGNALWRSVHNTTQVTDRVAPAMISLD